MSGRPHGRTLLAVAVLGVCALVVVVVLGVSGSGSGNPAVAACGVKSASEYGCFERRYRQLTKVSGIEAAFRELKREHRKTPFVRAVCHGLAHQIGRSAAQHHGDVAETYARGETFCGSGYYHGAMETIVAEIGAEQALARARSLCGEVGGPSQRSAFHRNCVHGLGHGFMVVQRNDVFASLPACDRLRASWEERNCYDGVFMQNIMSRNNRHYPSKHLKADAPMYPCTAVRQRYKERCYERQTVQALLTQDGDFGRVFKLCARVEAGFGAACHQGLGRDAAGFAIDNRASVPEQAAETAALCHLAGDRQGREACIAGATAFLLRQSESDTQAREFCRSLRGDLRRLCARTLERGRSRI